MSNVPEALTRPDINEWCLMFHGTEKDLATHIQTWSSSGLIVRTLRGRKMREYHSLFNEAAAALQFPWYFGENGNAFRECITDLSWLPQEDGYVLVITRPEEVLADTNDNGLLWLISLLDATAKEWATPVQEGQAWDRQAVPFHVVIQVDDSNSDRIRADWGAGGRSVGAIE